MKQCLGNNRTCRSHPGESGYCYMHDPERAAERSEARRRGGRATKRPHGADVTQLPGRVRSIEDVLAVLDYTLRESVVLDNGVHRNRLLASIASGFMEAIKVGEFEQRLAALEAQAAVKRPPSNGRGGIYVN